MDREDPEGVQLLLSPGFNPGQMVYPEPCGFNPGQMVYPELTPDPAKGMPVAFTLSPDRW